MGNGDKRFLEAAQRLNTQRQDKAERVKHRGISRRMKAYLSPIPKVSPKESPGILNITWSRCKGTLLFDTPATHWLRMSAHVGKCWPAPDIQCDVLVTHWLKASICFGKHQPISENVSMYWMSNV
ncbi:hypothetical protein BDN71DRAFT_1437383, partial [Pleurotus eryngii]